MCGWASKGPKNFYVTVVSPSPPHIGVGGGRGLFQERVKEHGAIRGAGMARRKKGWGSAWGSRVEEVRLRACDPGRSRSPPAERSPVAPARLKHGWVNGGK